MATLNNTIRASVFLILLGPPGSGKGTQAEKLRDRFGFLHVSTGHLFRENIAQGTELGRKIKELIANGELVSDDLTVAMVMDRLSKPDTMRGVVFDGFPRTRDQAIALHKALESENKHVAGAIYFQVADDVIVERLAARRTCPEDGAVYNLKSKPPKRDEICDNDGVPLVMREDDRPEVVRNRLEIYREQTEPLIEFYREMKLLVEVDAAQDIESLGAQVDLLVPTLITNAH